MREVKTKCRGCSEKGTVSSFGGLRGGFMRETTEDLGRYGRRAVGARRPPTQREEILEHLSAMEVTLQAFFCGNGSGRVWLAHGAETWRQSPGRG